MWEFYNQVRNRSLEIVSPLNKEDFIVQSGPDSSPAKWHLAHTTWFFERLILQAQIPDYKPFDPTFYELFNSYYQTLGKPWTRQNRGLLSRPAVDQIFRYREHVDQMMKSLLVKTPSQELMNLVRLGLEHEQQHQELLFMDIQHLFSTQYPSPNYNQTSGEADLKTCALKFKDFDGGLIEVGTSEAPFFYDNEGPRHKHYLHPFRLANRLVTNAEYKEFINDGGYENASLWHADGWTWVQEQHTKAPMYWQKNDGAWSEFTLQGEKPLEDNVPVSHINFYEASAFARYHKKRLPTEFEWEHAAASLGTSNGPFLEGSKLKKQVTTTDFADLCGVLWQWTQSSYLPYPGHVWQEGPLGEYNAKFMINQTTLRGGCIATPKDHFRLTYRNYFYAHQRWAFTGIRLAEDV